MPKKDTEQLPQNSRPRGERFRRMLLALALLLLLMATACEYMRATRASVSVTLPLSKEVRDVIGEGTFTNTESDDRRASDQRSAISDQQGTSDDRSATSNERVAGSDERGASDQRAEGSGQQGTSEQRSAGSDEQSGSDTGGTGDSGGSGGGSTGGGTNGGITGDSGGSGGGSTGGGGSDTGGGGSNPAPGGGGPDRRGGGGGGSGGGSDGGGTGGGDTGGGAPPGEGEASLVVKLRGSTGRIFFPRYHFSAGAAELQLDERRFTPGLYTLIVTKTYAISGRQEEAEQEFAWGVLAMNTDQDRYLPGETARIDIGVLDEYGAIVCDADLDLQITNPNGTVTTVSTSDSTIATTGTCGVKEAGFIAPDYETFITMNIEGTYYLELTANNLIGASHRLTSEVQVVSSPDFIVHRKAATRLWPVAPSPMTVDIEFMRDFSGTITDTVPDSFGITESTPKATTALVPATSELTLTWSGSWSAGDVATFEYVYDAPDISPEFYLIGPLLLTDSNGVTDTELRSWQIANDDVTQSTNYGIPTDVLAAGGGELALSSNYQLSDTIGEANIGFSRTSLYTLGAGYRQTESSFVSLGCGDLANLGTLSGGEGQLGNTIDCTVIADGAGYSLSWQGGAQDYTRIGHWKFDETSGTTAYDISGNANNGTHVGTLAISSNVPTTHFSTRSVDFSGDDYVTVGDLELTSGTVSMWIRPSAVTAGDENRLFSQTDSSTAEGGALGVGITGQGNGALSVWDGAAWNNISDTSAIAVNTWTHVAVTYQGAGGNVNAFINGQLQPQTATSDFDFDGYTAAIGAKFRLLHGNHWSGQVDEVRVYSSTLTGAAILALANTGPPASMVSAELNTIPTFEFPSTGGLVGHWKFDEIAGTTAADSSGNGNDGTHTNSPTISTTLPSAMNTSNVRSLSFDGSDDYVKSTTEAFKFTTDFTVSVWAKADTQKKWARIVDYSTFSSPRNGWFLGWNDSNQIYEWRLDDVGGGDGTVVSGTITLGQWYHLTGVYSKTEETYTLYVNGASVDSATTSGTQDYSSIDDLGIGARLNPTTTTTEFFDGLIDDVRIYNKALTAAEVKALAAQTQTWSIPTDTAYWGGRLSSTSTDTNAKWGTDDSSEKWIAVNDGSYTLVSRTSRTAVAGSTETLEFRAEVGSDKIQREGTYQGVLVITAAAL